MLRSLPARIDDTKLALVEQIARSSLPALPKPGPELFLACLRDMSILPRKSEDDCTGERRVQVYARLLGDYPAAAVRFMTKAVLERCKWFPTPFECLAIINEWRRADDALTARALARSILENERQKRFDELCDRIATMPQCDVDALPPSVKASLEIKCLLWRLPSGRFIHRTCDWPAALAFDRAETEKAAA